MPQPRELEQFIRYFCGNAADAQALGDAEPLRVSFYKAVASLTRAYADIAQHLIDAGYSDAAAAAIRAEVDAYADIRGAVKQSAGEELDTKPYESDMRHLLNTYVQADPAADLGNLGAFSLVQLIVHTGVHDATARKLNAKGKLSTDAIAEGIINNIRKTIIRDQLTDPKFYERMSLLLEDLIKQNREDTTAYEAFLRNAEALARQIVARGADDTVPDALRGHREAIVIYRNLPHILGLTAALSEAHEQSEALGLSETLPDERQQLVTMALAIDRAMREHAPAGWRGDQSREAQVQNALFVLLDRNREATIELFQLLKHQQSYP